MIAQVYVNTTNLNIDKPFDYLVPKELEDKVMPGVRVKVSFGGGNMPKEAFVTEVKEKSDFDSLKPIRSVTDNFPVLTKKGIELCFFMRKRYFCTFSEAAQLCIPPGTDAKFEEWISLSHKYFEKKNLVKGTAQEQLILLLEQNEGSAEMTQIKNTLGRNARATVNALIKKEICEKSITDKRRANEKTVRLAYYAGEEDISYHIEKLSKSAPKQAAVLKTVAEFGELSVSDIVAASGATRNAVEALHIKGLVSYREAEILRNPLEGKKSGDSEPLVLTDSQKMAADTILKKNSGTFLIHGVTGSGKTEVYMKIALNALKNGKQIILLVPEISLTPQMTSRFYNRFGDKVAVLHSALSLGERLDEWRRIRRGDASVIIGARSAIFAPCDNVGAIIIDEEHEQSYKSESSPRYHARDIAHFLAKKHNCPLILGSATPSIESYYKAKQGDYTLIELLDRFNKKPLPDVFISDMRQELKDGNKTVLSRLLATEIRENINRREKTILFLNRRGYSTFISCRDCGFVFTCPNCNVSLTYHKNGDVLTCHYCGHREKVNAVCPNCQSTRVRDFGKGTQKAEEQIESIFPDGKILRMDADTTSGKRGHEKLLDKFTDENIDILLGTQMVTKGLDFEDVTLVGVLAADASLNVDDFRAQERTFNLITQVCGRAGRGEKEGRCVIQTYSPENPTLLLAAKQDYKAFYEEEIMYRREFLYPPFCDIINITVSSSDKEEAQKKAAEIAMKLRVALRSYDNCSFYGPAAAPLSRIQGRHRVRLWLKCKADEEFIKILREAIYESSQKRNSDLSIVADINPYSMN
ncbi:MAG: primosomal protein N' [Ruminococcaceae bacterium]|nr:primosomal protein N' [Oscillospiraceae bacterium]